MSTSSAQKTTAEDRESPLREAVVDALKVIWTASVTDTARHADPTTLLPISGEDMSTDRFIYLSQGESRPTRVPVAPEFALKAGSEDTGGGYSVLEVTVGGDLPLHIHHNDDEVLYMLEGEIEATFDGRVYTVKPGDFMLLPRGIPHAVRPTSDVAPRLLQVSSPGGFEHFAEDLVESFRSLQDAGGPQAVSELAGKHGITFLHTPS
ncbi:cupin domain-containing protein [Streptomyces ossamyceticus]|uniref:cupin domain-containing protein n=1 Tax=Streptomyces ossamyceticus TaxID=249581 RepID=UPI000AA0F02E|nr:cupin domain-containing protein [Streptomyces ossamyceticus]